MNIDYLKVSHLIIEIIIFFILMYFGGKILNIIKRKRIRILNIEEYFPEAEIYTLIQISYLIMMGLLFITIIYILVFINIDNFYLAILDIILSLYLAITLDKSSLKNKILLILLIPYGSLTYIVFGNTLVGLIDFIHIPVFAYFLKVYYDKFREYTETNGLGIAVILLFSIIFFSFLTTQFVEDVNPLDSLVMVSNAFTSNGYAVLGTSIPGKLNSIVLVWGGYLLSGVGTATLTATILINHFSSRLDEADKKLETIEELVRKNNENNDE